MTNAELAKHFASLPPDEEASLQKLNADTGLLEDVSIDTANRHMLDQIDDDEFVRASDVPDEKDDDEDFRRELANKGRDAMVGQPVIFQKW